MMDKALQKKIETVKASLQGKKVLVAFSGGVDSTVMTRLALEFCAKVLAVTANSKLEPPTELEGAKTIAKELGVEWESVETNPLINPNFHSNPPNRCYFCKKEIMTVLLALAKKRHMDYIIDGTNFDDLKDLRPGYRAVQELKIKSPLAEAGITKKEIRLIAKEYNLSVFNKPAMPCLASRIPYGNEITEQKLTMIAEAESIIKTLTNVAVVRVRHHGSIARIEVPPQERAKFFDQQVLDQINAALNKLGFVYVTLDLQGYRSGSMNEALKESP
jgi:pyridinium-3,5-biscarboxylic acid mononucleotide sulfurtransferase